MKVLITCIAFGFLLSCSQKLHMSKVDKSIVGLINHEHERKVGIKNTSSFKSYDHRIYEVRSKAVRLFGIEVDTSKVTQFIVWDVVSFGGGGIDGKMILDDSLYYNYTASYRLGNGVAKSDNPLLPGNTDSVIEKYLKDHKFKELETLANEKGKTLSGSNFFYIGMYEKGMDSIYVNMLPAFIMN